MNYKKLGLGQKYFFDNRQTTFWYTYRAHNNEHYLSQKVSFHIVLQPAVGPNKYRRDNVGSHYIN